MFCFGAGASCLLLGPPVSNWCFFLLLRVSVSYSAPRISIVGQLTESVESSFLIHQDVYYLFVCP